MIDRLSPLARDGLIAGLTGAYYAGCAATGLLGLFGVTSWPNTTTEVAEFAYSLAITAFGLLATLSMLLHSRRSESAMLIAVGLVTCVHGIIVLRADPQTGLRVMIAPLALIPLAIYRSQTVFFRRDVRQQLLDAEERPS